MTDIGCCFSYTFVGVVASGGEEQRGASDMKWALWIRIVTRHDTSHGRETSHGGWDMKEWSISAIPCCQSWCPMLAQNVAVSHLRIRSASPEAGFLRQKRYCIYFFTVFGSVEESLFEEFWPSQQPHLHSKLRLPENSKLLNGQWLPWFSFQFCFLFLIPLAPQWIAGRALRSRDVLTWFCAGSHRTQPPICPCESWSQSR